MRSDAAATDGRSAAVAGPPASKETTMARRSSVISKRIYRPPGRSQRYIPAGMAKAPAGSLDKPRAQQPCSPPPAREELEMSGEIRRVVTTHDATGKAIVLFDS